MFLKAFANTLLEDGAVLHKKSRSTRKKCNIYDYFQLFLYMAPELNINRV